VKDITDRTISRVPASRFPEPAEVYFCDDCGRDVTKKLHRDRAPVWQPLRPIWFVCQCGRKYLSGAAEWDDLTAREREQRIRQLQIGFVLFALLVIPVTLAYFALRYGGAALLAVVGIALIPSILVAKPFWFVLIDLYEIIASIWRTRGIARRPFTVTTVRQWMMRSRLHNLRLSLIAAVIAALILGSHWTPSHLGAATHMSAMSSPERSNAGPQQTLLAPTLLLRPARVAVPGAPGPEFRRVRVGPNEIDYIAEDVTIRQFVPTLARQRAPRTYKEVQMGTDVTIRYFSSTLTIAPPTRSGR
jgi:hypothetical protein